MSELSKLFADGITPAAAALALMFVVWQLVKYIRDQHKARLDDKDNQLKAQLERHTRERAALMAQLDAMAEGLQDLVELHRDGE